MAQRFASATCPTCDTEFARLPLDFDEDGDYLILPVTACAHGTCGKLLCPCCDQFHCDGCGETFCADHLVSVPDGTERPLHCCPVCAEECEQIELPLPMPPASEVRIAAVAGMGVA